MCQNGETVDCFVIIPPELSYTGDFRFDIKGIDRCIAHLINQLNHDGLYTSNSCCGHGEYIGSIYLHDGTKLIIVDER